MPDWITHITLTYLITKPLKVFDYRFLFLGAVLPDISKLLEILLGFLVGNQIVFYMPFIEPFHTPFIMLLFSLAIAFVTDKPKFTFFSIFFATFFHFFLDSFQKHIGYYNLLLYPFSFKNYTIAIIEWNQIKFFLMPLIILFYWIYKSQKRIVKFRFNFLSILFVLIALVIISQTKSLFVKNNIFSLEFIHNPQKWEVKFIEINKMKVIDTNPVIIQLGERKLELVTDEKLKIGDRLGFKGYYKEEKLYPVEIKLYKDYLKSYISIVGVIFLILLWCKNGM